MMILKMMTMMTTMMTDIGVTDVIIEDSGYGYEAYAYGDKGGMGRVWILIDAKHLSTEQIIIGTPLIVEVIQ